MQPAENNEGYVVERFTHVSHCQIIGKNKLRLEMGNKTHKFAINLFKDNEIDERLQKNNNGKTKNNQEWVKLKIDNEETVYADVASITSQFGIDQLDVEDYAYHGNLENFLQNHINDYLVIQEFAEKNYNTREEIGENLARLNNMILNPDIKDQIKKMKQNLKSLQNEVIPVFINLAKEKILSMVEKHLIKNLSDCRKFTGEATNVGWFSGKEKLRLELGDKTKRFAIGLFKDDEIDENVKGKNKGKTLDKKDWVKLTIDNEETVYAEVASIASRFNLSKSEVKKLAKKGELEETLQIHINEYKAINQFANLDNDTVKKLNDHLDELEVSIKNQNVLKIIWGIRGKLQGLENKKISNFSDKIKNELLLAIDEHYTKKPPIREKITKNEEINGLMLTCNCRAKKLGPDSKGEEAVRLKLADPDDENAYAIKTDGYIYSERPEMTDNYIPYILAENKWVLLDINSLSYRLYIANEESSVESFKEAFKKYAADDLTGKQLSKNIGNLVFMKTSNSLEIENITRKKSELSSRKTTKNQENIELINDIMPMLYLIEMFNRKLKSASEFVRDEESKNLINSIVISMKNLVKNSKDENFKRKIEDNLLFYNHLNNDVSKTPTVGDLKEINNELFDILQNQSKLISVENIIYEIENDLEKKEVIDWHVDKIGNRSYYECFDDLYEMIKKDKFESSIKNKILIDINEKLKMDLISEDDVKSLLNRIGDYFHSNQLESI
jgi:hypothetical protein